MTAEHVTPADITAAEHMVESAKRDLDAMRGRAADLMTGSRPPSVDTGAMIAGAVTRVDMAQAELDRRTAVRQTWLDDQADRPRRETEAADVIKAAGKEIDDARKRIVATATAAQTALVDLLDAGKAYDQAVRRAAAALAARDLPLIPGEADPDNGAGAQSMGEQVVRLSGRWHLGINDPAQLIRWVLAQVAHARLPAHHPMTRNLGWGAHGPLQNRTDGIFDGVPAVKADKDRVELPRAVPAEIPQTPVRSAETGRQTRRRARS